MFKEAGVKGDVNVGGVVTRDGLENVRELFRKHLMFGFHNKCGDKSSKSKKFTKFSQNRFALTLV